MNGQLSYAKDIVEAQRDAEICDVGVYMPCFDAIFRTAMGSVIANSTVRVGWQSGQ